MRVLKFEKLTALVGDPVARVVLTDRNLHLMSSLSLSDHIENFCIEEEFV